MHITSTRGFNKYTHDGVTYEPVQGFVFDLPWDVAQRELGMSDQNGPFWRLPEPDDYDLPGEDIAPVQDGKAPAARRTAPRASKRAAVQGVPGPDVAGQ
jgi:hypothetical protein